MKGLIFMVIVTLLVLASFARPEKEINTPDQSSIKKAIAPSDKIVALDSTNTTHYKRS